MLPCFWCTTLVVRVHSSDWSLSDLRSSNPLRPLPLVLSTTCKILSMPARDFYFGEAAQVENVVDLIEADINRVLGFSCTTIRLTKPMEGICSDVIERYQRRETSATSFPVSVYSVWAAKPYSPGLGDCRTLQATHPCRNTECQLTRVQLYIV